ncbi:MAG: hypothetical protein WAT67_12365, partial [Candidatus Contendobacter sp.]
VEADALRAHAAASGRPLLRLTDTAPSTGDTGRGYATLAELSGAVDSCARSADCRANSTKNIEESKT